jgi:hypothetical protein
LCLFHHFSRVSGTVFPGARGFRSDTRTTLGRLLITVAPSLGTINTSQVHGSISIFHTSEVHMKRSVFEGRYPFPPGEFSELCHGLFTQLLRTAHSLDLKHCIMIHDCYSILASYRLMLRTIMFLEPKVFGTVGMSQVVCRIEQSVHKKGRSIGTSGQHEVPRLKRA